MPLTRRTLTRLAEAVADQFSHAYISNLYFEFSVDASDPGDGPNKLTRSRELVRAIEAGHAEIATDEALVDLSNRVLDSEYARERHTALLASLAADGFEWGLDRLVPSMPLPAQPAPEVSALESDLDRPELRVAATHYRQAVDNFVDGNFEAANGQLRSFLEALFQALGVSAGAQTNVGADAAVVHLRRVGSLDEAESRLLRGLWAGAQDNGPHAGLTNEEEARFRLHTATAAARYLLRRRQ
ncbi:MAG: hypothetical protein F4Y45_07770 [Acidobacteria bacterium]|nr:hypothetical protein [Acidobacteriota bacterium]MYJ03518.1 hypothetical protein [Acidobacteriota bacterium]